MMLKGSKWTPEPFDHISNFIPELHREIFPSKIKDVARKHFESQRVELSFGHTTILITPCYLLEDVQQNQYLTSK